MLDGLWTLKRVVVNYVVLDEGGTWRPEECIGRVQASGAIGIIIEPDDVNGTVTFFPWDSVVKIEYLGDA